MEVTAQLNRLRIAPRKTRAVAKLIKGKDVLKALSQLEYTMRKSAPYLTKLIRSAIANSENNFNMVKENLYIKDLVVDEGVKLLRFRPKGFGRSSRIQKKTSHIKIVLAERVAGLKRKDEVPKHKTSQEAKETTVESTEKEVQNKKPEIKRELGKKTLGLSGIGKRIFRRKAI